MDLLECPGCGRRFIATTDTAPSPDAGFLCSSCGDELELEVSSIPGPAQPLADTLGAQLLDPGSESDEAPEAGGRRAAG